MRRPRLPCTARRAEPRHRAHPRSSPCGSARTEAAIRTSLHSVLGLALLTACGATAAPVATPLGASSNARNGAGVEPVLLRVTSGPAQFELVYDVTITASGMAMGTIRSRGIASLEPGPEGTVLTRRITTASSVDRDGAPMGSDVSMLTGLSFVTTLGARGETIGSDTSGGPTDPLVRLAAQITLPQPVIELAEAEVSPGDTWTSHFDLSTFAILGFGTLSCAVTARLVAIEGTGDARIAVVHEEGPCTRTESQARLVLPWDVSATFVADTRIAVSDGVVRARSGGFRVRATMPDAPDFVMELGADLDLRIDRLAE